ncbi:MAG: sulfotransferase family protein [Thermoguttaceae bacterium]
MSAPNTSSSASSASTTTSSVPVRASEMGGYKDRFWYPRFWDGMTFGAWLGVLFKGRFRIAPVRIAMVVLVMILGVLNTFLACVQFVLLGRRVRQTQLTAPPIFIVGHWRSGTTLLHEYMIRDEQFTFADTYACFAPSHFLISRHFIRPLVAPLMPKKRPIDNMIAGFDRPQEDEFALAALGVPSPYLQVLFPNNRPLIDDEYLTLHNVGERQRTVWLDALEWFLKALTVVSPRRIILKSPPHTARIRTLLSRWKDAKFVHIHRDPQALFPSTYNLWMRLATDEGCQRPNGDGLDEKVLATFETMYEAFFEDVALLGDGQFCEVGFDELTASPVETLERIYRELRIDGFETVREEMTNYAATQKHYRKNKFQTDSAVATKIDERWKKYREHYGYTEREA